METETDVEWVGAMRRTIKLWAARPRFLAQADDEMR